MINDFAFQWLDVAKLDEITPDSRQFSQASGLLDQRALLKEELRLFIDSVFRPSSDAPGAGGSVTDLLTANYTFLNERRSHIERSGTRVASVLFSLEQSAG